MSQMFLDKDRTLQGATRQPARRVSSQVDRLRPFLFLDADEHFTEEVALQLLP